MQVHSTFGGAFLFLGFSACSPLLAHVRPGPADALVSRKVEFDVLAPRAQFVKAFLAAPLARFIPGTKTVPGVDRTEPLTASPYPAVGSVRLVVLKDHSTAHEEVLECNESTLLYLVTEYTSDLAAPVEYGLGEFRFAEAGDRTHVTWNYSFKLRGNRFPGWLGGLGRSLFRSRFVDKDYAEFMAGVALAIQKFGAREGLAPQAPPDAAMSPCEVRASP